MSASSRPIVAIVGAGFGGLAVARGLKRTDADIVLIDRVNHHLFQPLLYQVATAAVSPADIATAIRTLLRGQPNATMIMAEVEGAEVGGAEVGGAEVGGAPGGAGRLALSGGGVQPFDFLVLSPGASYDFFGHPDWAEHALVLKSLEDALAIRARLLTAFEDVERRRVAGDPAPAPTFAVIGGGPTGVELAGAIAEMSRTTLARDFRRLDPAKARVILFETGPRLLSAFPEALSDYAARALGDLGVEVRLNTAVDAIDADGVEAGGQRQSTAAVLWCAGVRARPAAHWLALPSARNGAVVVEKDGRVPGQPRIFAIGDVSHRLADDRPFPGLAPVAKQQGAHVARVIHATIMGSAPPPPFKYRDWGTMAVIGRSKAVAVLGGWRLKGGPAWLAWSLVHLMLLVDFRSRLSIYIAWTWAWFTYGRSARLITSPRGGA